MRSRGAFLTVLVVAMSLVMALPASANKVKPKEGMVAPVKAVGLLQGVASVGKTGTCSNDGTGTVAGAGLGLPYPVTKAKNGWWKIDDTIITQADGAGILQACGKLMPVGNVVMPSKRPEKPAVKPGIGASCGMSKGHSGFGKITKDGVPDKAVYLRNLGWKISGITITVYGDAVQAADSEDHKTKQSQDKVLAVVQAQGGGPCTTKRDNNNPPIGTGKKQPGQGATSFDVVGAFWVRQASAADVDLNDQPGFCKDSDDPTCAYPDKK